MSFGLRGSAHRHCCQPVVRPGRGNDATPGNANFHDGKVGIIELINELWGPMFEPLKDPDLLLQAKVDPELVIVIWPNGADLAPEFLDQGAQHDPSVDDPQVARH